MDDLTNLTEKTAGGVELAGYNYTLALDGTRTAATEVTLQANGDYDVTTINWTYDADNRLTEESESTIDSSTQEPDYTTGQNYTDIYTYDLAANRLEDIHTAPSGAADVSGITGNQNQTTTYTYNADDELITQAVDTGGTTVTTTFSYDAAGNQIESSTGTDGSGGITTYTYNLLNQMASVTINDVVTTYVYDDAGNRVEETTPSTGSGQVTTFYLTDTNNPTGYSQPIEQWTSTTGSIIGSTHVMTYILGNRVLGQVDGSTTPNFSYFLTDGHGSTRMLVNSAGVVAAWMNYNAYGTALNFNASTPPTLFLFGGDAIYDPASGLYLHGNGVRASDGFYFTQADPSTGLTSDPLYLNKYLYADGDPINMVDPSGHDGLLETLMVAAWNLGDDVADAFAAIATKKALISGLANVAISYAWKSMIGEEYSLSDAGIDFTVGAVSVGGEAFINGVFKQVLPTLSTNLLIRVVQTATKGFFNGILTSAFGIIGDFEKGKKQSINEIMLKLELGALMGS